MQTHVKRVPRPLPKRVFLSRPHFTSIIKLIAGSNKSKPQARAMATLHNLEQVPEPALNKDYLNYIIVPPDKLKLFIGDDDPIIFMESFRTKGLTYKNAAEDKFLEKDPDTEGDAFVYYQDVFQMFFVHCPQNGRFYITESLFEACDILRAIEANEASKEMATVNI